MNTLPERCCWGLHPVRRWCSCWSYLTRGDAAYTLVQVAVNDLIIPCRIRSDRALLLGVGGCRFRGTRCCCRWCCSSSFRWGGRNDPDGGGQTHRGIDYFNNVFVKSSTTGRSAACSPRSLSSFRFKAKRFLKTRCISP